MARKESSPELPTNPGRYGFGGGLWLQVRNEAHRSWLFRYAFQGRAREMGLGSLDRVPLEAARTEAARWRQMLREGGDPIDERRRLAKEEERRRASEKTFRVIAEETIEKRESNWRNAKSAKQWRRSFERYVYPKLGGMRPRDIEIEHVKATLEPIWQRIPESASRIRQRIEIVLRSAKTKGLCSGENPARWKEGLDEFLSKPPRKDVHYPALSWKQIGIFMEHLRSIGSTPARALQFMILTAGRSGMVRKATWSEIDLEERVWRVPKEHMKNKKAFQVPLSGAAIAVLHAQAGEEKDPNGLIFPGADKRQPLSDMTLSMLVRRMSQMEGGALRYEDPERHHAPVPHGFRSTFRDWCGDTTAFPREITEAALAHKVESSVEAAYRRSTAFEIRRLLMEEWATFCARGKRPWSPEELRLQPGLALPGGMAGMVGPAAYQLLSNLVQEMLRHGYPGSASTPPGPDFAVG